MAAISLYASVTSFIVRHRDVTRRLFKTLQALSLYQDVDTVASLCFSNINHNQNAIQQMVNYVIMWQALQRLYNVGWISNSWFSLLWWDGHVGLQNNGKMSLFVGFFENFFTSVKLIWEGWRRFFTGFLGGLSMPQCFLLETCCKSVLTGNCNSWNRLPQ